MRNDWGKRLTRTRKHVLIASLMLTVSTGALGVASPALANFAQFAQCPTSAPGVEYCNFAQTTSGEFSIGKTRVPIEKTITLQGGAIPDGAGGYFLYPAKNGESLSKTEQNVPGGLLDFINCKEITGEGLIEKGERFACEAIFENKVTGVTATTELVANEHNPAILNTSAIFSQSETALTLPVRVHLKNPFLGNNCYIGSESSPIQLNLTTGTTTPPLPNKPITGKVGEPATEEETIFVLKNNSLVENAFYVPTTEGCGEFNFFGLIIKGYLDGLVNGKLGLPSKGGNNTAILTGTLKIASAKEVVAHGY